MSSPPENYTGLWTVSKGAHKVSEGRYVDGRREGVHAFFYSDGTIERCSTYVDGEKSGEERVYNMAGDIIREASYKNGVLHGHFREFSYDGGLLRDTVYEEGKGTVIYQRGHLHLG